MNAIETQGLAKRYRRTWALAGCNLTIPAGRVVALVGPNGAGKSTLIHLTVGLLAPTTGSIAVLGGQVPGSPGALQRVAFVAQDTPLYKNLSAADTLRLVASMSATWDEANARERLGALEIPLDRRVGQLSGGQYAQVALAVALARHPELLVLDEPVARLDPLARHDFLATLMAAVAEEGISVVLSSHVVAELQRVCDYLVVLNRGTVQLAGDVDELLVEHRILSGPAEGAASLPASLAVVSEQRTDRHATLLARTGAAVSPPPGWEVSSTNLEELVLAYLRSPSASALPGPQRSAESRASA
ncbi:MAG TPA: ABC transporter ATP-binding protein [Actinomycetota bacterium]|nr:ABC transporter ATP-binding protein [Actinomycetota bacterium]